MGPGICCVDEMNKHRSMITILTWWYLHSLRFFPSIISFISRYFVAYLFHLIVLWSVLYFVAVTVAVAASVTLSPLVRFAEHSLAFSNMEKL